MLETQQKEVHDALVAMEGEALRLYRVTVCPFIIMHALAIYHIWLSTCFPFMIGLAATSRVWQSNHSSSLLPDQLAHVKPPQSIVTPSPPPGTAGKPLS